MSDSVPDVSTASSTAWRGALAVLLGGLGVRLLFAALLPLFPDEAYYWDWSRHLAAGYFDHPGGIALLVAAGTALLGDTSPFAVRFLPVLAGFVATLAGIGIARRLCGDRAALLASLVVTSFPIAAAGLVLATPDTPLLATTAVALYAVVRAIQAAPHSRASLGWWLTSGIALGLAFSSKYTSILLPFSVVLAVLGRRDLRVRLSEPGPYLACLVATLVFLPVLWWNAQHGWISFGFQIHHGLGAPRRDPLAPLKRLGDLIGGQAALASPILFVMLAVATAQALRRASSGDRFLLGVVAAVTFLFFCVSATRKRVEANWPAPAYIPAIALLASVDWPERGRRWLRAGIALAAIFSALISLHAAFAILPVPPNKDPVARSAGYEALADSAWAAAQAAARATGRAAWLGADRYQDAAELGFYAPGQPITFATNLSGRANQYDLWPRFADVARPGDNLVLALDEGSDTPAVAVRLEPYFSSESRVPLVELRSRRGIASRRRLWVLGGWRGGWPR